MKLPAILMGIVVVAVGMAISNPSKERYVEYATTEFLETGKKSLCAGDMPIAAQQSCKFLISQSISQGKGVITSFVDTSTNRQNFILFSLYETDLPNQKITTIAAFGNFYMFK